MRFKGRRQTSNDGAIEQSVILEALRPVQDPELNRSIVDLDMVRGISIDGGDVAVLVALTVAGCPMRSEITRRVTDAVSSVAGVERVKVDMTVMTPDELDAVRQKMQGGNYDAAHAHGAGDDHAGHDHGPAERVIPFNDNHSNTRVLAVTSGKGGVGKSSVAVNLAVALAKQGHDVAVLDADVYGFSVPAMLGLTEKPDVIDGMMVPPTAYGVKCISLGFFVDEFTPVMWRGPMLHKALEQFLVDVAWGDLDYLVVDMPPGTGDVAMSMAKYLPRAETYVVTTPQPAAQRVAQRSGAMAREIGLPLHGVIENMSWFTGDDGKRYELFGAGGGQRLADDLDTDLLACIPLVPDVREGGDNGIPVTVAAPGSEVAEAFAALASVVEKAVPRRVYRAELTVR